MIAILDYGAGNTGSVRNALHRLGCDGIVTADPDQLRAADKVLLPGVGEASSAMTRLRDSGLAELLPGITQPVLGICLGLQLLCRHSEEGDTPCLGLIDTAVRRFPAGHIVPHMGWNSLQDCRGPLLGASDNGTDLYFVHSYYAEVCAATASTCQYILPFSATLQHNNFYAAQFHPEKSGAAGEVFLQKFLSL